MNVENLNIDDKFVVNLFNIMNFTRFQEKSSSFDIVIIKDFLQFKVFINEEKIDEKLKRVIIDFLNVFAK